MADKGLTDLTPAAWVATLRARGVTLELRGNRLTLRPTNAYKELSDAELLTLRHHREEIKAIVKTGGAAVVVSPPTRNDAPAPTAHDLLRDGPVEVLGGGRVRPVKVDKVASEAFAAAMRRRMHGW